MTAHRTKKGKQQTAGRSRIAHKHQQPMQGTSQSVLVRSLQPLRIYSSSLRSFETFGATAQQRNTPDAFDLQQHSFVNRETRCIKDEAQIALFKDPVRTAAINTFHLGYKNQSVYAVSGTSRCLFSDKYETQKYSVGRTYNC